MFNEPNTSGAGSAHAVRNFLLASMGEVEAQRIIASAEQVALTARDLLHEPGERIQFAYFPFSGLIAGNAAMQDGRSVEVVSIGREGMTGLRCTMGDDRGHYRLGVQVSGVAWRIEIPLLRRHINARPAIAEAIRRYSVARLFEAEQLAACNALHTVEQRLCRWLLLAHNRVGNETLPMTHEMLADNLGAQRSTVSLAAGNLDRAGMISYKRGLIRVESRERLQACTCECYSLINSEFARLYSRT